jgi:hypothetical protein
MSIRAFDWRDLPTLHRYRNQSVYLHSSLVLTRGSWLISGAIISTLAPSTGIFTSVSTNNGSAEPMLIGQIIHTPGTQNAQITFLAPDAALNTAPLFALLDHLSTQSVERGAFRLLADVDENSPAFEALRQSGYAIYARQRIWRFANSVPTSEPGGAEPAGWRPAEDRDLIPVRSLYNNLIPGLVQQVEPFPPDRLKGHVFYHQEDLLAYVEVKYGHRGIWAQPFVHPDAEDVGIHLSDLLQNLPKRNSRPVYVCVRSYQSWLESEIEELGAEPSPRQAIMVRHLAIPQKALRTFALPALEGGRPEASAPVARLQSAHPNGGAAAGTPLEKQ